MASWFGSAPRVCDKDIRDKELATRSVRKKGKGTTSIVPSILGNGESIYNFDPTAVSAGRFCGIILPPLLNLYVSPRQKKVRLL
jgi:hypothetical protein